MNKEETSSSKMDWIIFLISTLVMIAMLIWLNEWFWLAMPFSLTYLVKALKMM
jgi:4-hydroxybenzoate polyprenyltransferase